ncbi:AOX, alternative oxidase mitochondrial precursor [Hysterangium stoloniferum]|nr:AOX, alternative oxidase mitochondrial precursor [Hysterangium stoloniferum]
MAPGELTATPPQKNAVKGTEGMHRNDMSMTDPTGSVIKPPPIHGDWVLFHPVYTADELKAVKVLHHDAKTWSDKFALLFVKTLRTGFDLVSRYKHKPVPESAKHMNLDQLRKAGYIMDEKQWLLRILFLETVAGVPGMVGAMVRHLMSLRLMKRDAGWIHTLLEEAENERLHLMTFMTLKKPTIWFRAMVLGAQGVFFNAFFLSYLISPKTCHRFVGFLEEEAVITYSRVIEEIEAGRIPEWTNLDAPSIAKDYWRMKPDAKLIDVMYAVRSDESTHRFVNHTLANLDVKNDVNPFAIREPNMFVKGVNTGFTREESEKYVHESRNIVETESTKEPRSS